MSEEQATEAPAREVQAEQQGNVPLYEASDADIDSFLEKNLGGEVANAAPEKEEETPAESPKEQTQSDGEGEPKNADYWKQKAEDTERRLAETRKHVEQQEQFIQRRSNELGEQRKIQKELLAALDLKIEEEVDPGKIAELVAEKREAKEAEQKLANEQQAIEQQHQSQKIVFQALGTKDINFESLADVLRADKVPEQNINAFLQNPWGNAGPDTLIQLDKRAKERAILNQVLKKAKEFYDENQKLKGKPAEVVKGMQAAFNAQPELNGPSGTTGDSTSLPSDVTTMGDAELDEILKAKGML